jgi:hypothetical protein
MDKVLVFGTSLQPVKNKFVEIIGYFEDFRAIVD